MVDRTDIDAMIEDAGEQIGRVRELYDESLRAKRVPAKLQARIKNVVEAQRSALEYLANSIYERHGDGKGRHSYYPVAKAPTAFREQFDRQLPGVAANCPSVRDAVEIRQPDRENYEWLSHLSLLTNENKHRRLTPQTRKEQRTVKYEHGGASVTMTGNAGIFLSGPGADISLGGRSIRAVPRAETVYVDWFFEEPPVPALGTLERIQESLPSLVDDIIAALR